jgi:hypothetical protein
MYSGPTLNRNLFCELNFTSCGRIVPDYWPLYYQASCLGRWDQAVGWLGTGDAELQSRTSFDEFVSHYQKYLKYVDILTIPHHGSFDNYCSGLGEIGHCAVLTSDHVNDPKGFHPSDKVMVNLRTKYPFIFIVTRDADSAVYSNVEVFVQ